jgi:hypothetical protein
MYQSPLGHGEVYRMSNNDHAELAKQRTFISQASGSSKFDGSQDIDAIKKECRVSGGRRNFCF